MLQGLKFQAGGEPYASKQNVIPERYKAGEALVEIWGLGTQGRYGQGSQGDDGFVIGVSVEFCLESTHIPYKAALEQPSFLSPEKSCPLLDP